MVVLMTGLDTRARTPGSGQGGIGVSRCTAGHGLHGSSCALQGQGQPGRVEKVPFRVEQY